jgi:hypothetical protein
MTLLTHWWPISKNDRDVVNANGDIAVQNSDAVKEAPCLSSRCYPSRAISTACMTHWGSWDYFMMDYDGFVGHPIFNIIQQHCGGDFS